jgi:hypothetical protein
MRCHNLLSPIAWERFPERNLRRNWGQEAVPYASFAAACLLKLDYGFTCMTQLHRFLARHPEMVWLLGFPRRRMSHNPRRCDAASSLPTARHFTRLLRTIPNAKLQFLLDDTVRTLRRELAPVSDDFGQTISLDTKHILAWVKENNPKTYCREGRFDKHNLPKGDPDCRLGCKRRHNQRSSAQEATPTHYPSPAGSRTIGEFYWGYASGVVAVKVAGWGEFVLAEYTQPFDRPDVSYFFPLMADVERRLGFRPRFGALDAAFDAFYVYEYFHQAGGFAAVPFSKRGGHLKTFDDNGLPHCAAGLPMPLKYTFICRTGCLNMNADATIVLCCIHSPPVNLARSSTSDGRKAAAPPHWQPALGHVSAINWTVKVKSTGGSTNSARPRNASTPRPKQSALNAPGFVTHRELPIRTR